MGEDPEVDKLANSLKRSGVASSWIDAISKAKAILGFSNRKEEAPKIKIAEPTPEQKTKVDEIIKEVDAEIKGEVLTTERIVEEKQEPENIVVEEEKEDIAEKINDPNFNIAESDMKVDEIVKAGEEIFTNDPETLDKEKEGDKMEREEDSIMTNEEMNEEKPVESSEENVQADNLPEESAEEKDAENAQNSDDIEGDSEDMEEDSTYTEEKEITKEKTLFDFEEK